MREKPTRGRVTILLLAGLMGVCCLGPILFASFAAGVFTWIDSFDPLRSILVAVLVAIAVFTFFQWRKRRTIKTTEMKKL